jgi:hypothetical protein
LAQERIGSWIGSRSGSAHDWLKTELAHELVQEMVQDDHHAALANSSLFIIVLQLYKNKNLTSIYQVFFAQYAHSVSTSTFVCQTRNARVMV